MLRIRGYTSESLRAAHIIYSSRARGVSTRCSSGCTTMLRGRGGWTRMRAFLQFQVPFDFALSIVFSDRRGARPRLQVTSFSSGLDVWDSS